MTRFKQYKVRNIKELSKFFGMKIFTKLPYDLFIYQFGACFEF